VGFTPTFILVEEGRAIGRIMGHPGESFFRELLSQFFEKLPNEKSLACVPGV
tara:strand:+ start:453 stop:608 length:156 start_codon:yes stop_codon:yes gene_type:complete